MGREVSIAIETSSRAGGVALGVGDEMVGVCGFDASGRHATQLIPRVGELLARAGFGPCDLDHAYVSAGPGSFTGLRIGITVIRTLGQLLDNLRCVSVPTPEALADNARSLAWEHLGVLLDAKDALMHTSLFIRKDGEIQPARPPAVQTPQQFLAESPRPLLLIGEALGCYDLTGEGIELTDRPLHLPTPEGVWRVGRAMARAGRFTEYRRVVPIYSRRPEAVRLWEKRRNSTGQES